MTEAMTETIAFRAPTELAEWLQARAARTSGRQGVQARARVELDMWRTVLRAEAARTTWTLAEIGVLAHLQSSTIIDDVVPLGIGTLAAQVHDVTHDLVDWGIDMAALLAKCRALGPAADIATVDALARWWTDDTRDNSIDGWASVGLSVIE